MDEKIIDDGSKKLNILFLTPRFPYPVIGGDRLKPYHILSHLAKNNNVTLVTFNHGGEPEKYCIKAIEDLGVELKWVPLFPVIAGFRTMLRMFGKKPLEVLFYTQPEYSKLVENLFKEKNFDIGISFFMRTAEYIKNKPLKKILMAEDCRTIYQKRSFEDSTNSKQRIIRNWEFKKLSSYEPKIVDYFDITTFVTNEDIASMMKLNNTAEYRLLTNGTNIESFKPPGGNSVRSGILFSGKLDVWANQLMVKKIVEDIFPLIKNEVPNATLNIVGANPPQSVTSLIKDSKDITLVSNVPEMQPYLQKSEVFLHPHTGGSGIQNKLLEAMACGCPVVTTNVGNQGINGVHERDLLLGEDSATLAKHAVRLIKNKEFALEISKNARNLIEKTHSWYVVFDAIDNIIFELFDELNFEKQ